ncbi:MAG: hypothetical protein PUB31_01550 [Bacteroidales bacterium]|nr:hypothetical protein [Bacteroidales bacterium]MDD6621619.1 hypothetical protein [Bacteroidales bacterium]
MEIVDTELSDYVFELKKYYEKLLPSHINSKPKADIPSMSRFLMKVALQDGKEVND